MKSEGIIQIKNNHFPLLCLDGEAGNKGGGLS